MVTKEAPVWGNIFSLENTCIFENITVTLLCYCIWCIYMNIHADNCYLSNIVFFLLVQLTNRMLYFCPWWLCKIIGNNSFFLNSKILSKFVCILDGWSSYFKKIISLLMFENAPITGNYSTLRKLSHIQVCM